MVWLKYDWQKDRAAFWNVDTLRNNLWYQIGQKTIRMTNVVSIITINDTIKNSVFNKQDFVNEIEELDSRLRALRDKLNET